MGDACRCFVLLVLSQALACGGGGTDQGSCELDLEVSGALSWQNRDRPACGIPFGGKSGVLMVFLPHDDTVASVFVDVADITEGAVGSFPATVELTAEDEREWHASACTAQFTMHDFDFEDATSTSYLTAGTVECEGDAVAVGGDTTDTVVIHPFAFRFPARW